MKGFIQVSLLVPCTLSENCICKYCILVAPGQLFADLRQWNDAPLHIIPSQDFKIVKTSEQRDWQWQCFRQNQINCYWNNVIATNHRQSEFLGTIFAAFQRLQFSVLADWRMSSLAPSSLLSHTLVSTEHLGPRISGAWTLLIYSRSCQFWRDGRTRQYMDLSIALCRGWWWRGQAGEMAGPHITDHSVQTPLPLCLYLWSQFDLEISSEKMSEFNCWSVALFHCTDWGRAHVSGYKQPAPNIMVIVTIQNIPSL